jgi:hypothetical protein
MPSHAVQRRLYDETGQVQKSAGEAFIEGFAGGEHHSSTIALRSTVERCLHEHMLSATLETCCCCYECSMIASQPRRRLCRRCVKQQLKHIAAAVLCSGTISVFSRICAGRWCCTPQTNAWGEVRVLPAHAVVPDLCM